MWSLGIPRTAKYSILEKYQIALTLMGSEKFDQGKEPFQSAKKVVKLRNALVHYEPTFEPYSDSPSNSSSKAHPLGKDLARLFKLNPLCAEWAPIWPYKIFGAGCAKWCSESAFNFLEGFHNMENLKETLDEVEKNHQSFVILRNGHPIADLVPHVRRNRIQPHPEMSKIKIDYDPTEPLDDEDWSEME